jgi:HK97 family phage prohead protease
MAESQLRFELKSLEPDGSFSGYGSTYLNTDLVGDRCMPGCFTKSLLDSGAEVPLLWQHQDPVGVARLADSPKGLHVSGRLVLGVAKAMEAYELLKARAVRGLSIGYDSIKTRLASDGVRELLEVRLHEMSLVAIPANPMAQVTAVKSGDVSDQVRLFRAILVEARKTFR